MRDKYSLKNKVIVVTGGTGVLGDSFINGIAEAGGIVGILGRNEEVANKRAAGIQQNGGQAIALVADVMNEDNLMASRNKVLRQFGKIDGLVNAAGGNQPAGVLLPDQDIFKMDMEGM